MTSRLLNADLIPSIGDAPEISSTAVPSCEPRGPYGAKEVGEGSMVPVLGSIANAIYDAVGVRITELPITPERVLRALRGKRGEGQFSSSPCAEHGRCLPTMHQCGTWYRAETSDPDFKRRIDDLDVAISRMSG